MNTFFRDAFAAAITDRNFDMAEDIATKAGEFDLVIALRKRHTWQPFLDGDITDTFEASVSDSRSYIGRLIEKALTGY